MIREVHRGFLTGGGDKVIALAQLEAVDRVRPEEIAGVVQGVGVGSRAAVVVDRRLAPHHDQLAHGSVLPLSRSVHT